MAKKTEEKAPKKALKPKTENRKPKVGAAAYGAEQISVLEGLEPVRKRPGMYIGSTGPDGLFHLLREVADNSFDEAMAGHATTITVKLLPDDYVEVSDDGRGIPVEKHAKHKVSALELVMTKLHAGGKFGGETSGYKISGGLHGVGVSVVNALSEHLVVTVRRDGGEFEQEYVRGKPKSGVKKVGTSKEHGTTVRFKPDREIFKETTTIPFQRVIEHYRQQCYLTKGIKLVAIDEREAFPSTYAFYFEGGVASYVRHLNRERDAKHDNVFYVEKQEGPAEVAIALQYTDDYQENLFAFTNNIINPEGGTHVIGFRSALTRVLNNYARKKGYLKEKEGNLSGEDVREGLTVVISVRWPEPQFEGQTKGKLGTPEVRAIVEGVMSDALATFMEEHPKDAEAILSKCILSQRARAAARAARETVMRKGALEGMTLPGKLADCSSRNPDECELFIVEGDSAGGTAKQGRDRETQAILPLRGKILNVERARLDKMLGNEQIKNLVIALGTNIGEQFELDKLRYNRVVIMTDADVDGAHIRILLLTLFYRYFQELIHRGHIFIAQPPLYRISKGKAMKYAYSDAERDQILDEFRIANDELRKKDNKKGKAEADEQEVAAAEDESLEVAEVEGVDKISGVNIQRYKGLGEMNAEQLWETTMDPAVRLMKIVTIHDAERANTVFEVLMGSEVPPRKKFIQTNAKKVKNLDI